MMNDVIVEVYQKVNEEYVVEYMQVFFENLMFNWLCVEFLKMFSVEFLVLELRELEEEWSCKCVDVVESGDQIVVKLIVVCYVSVFCDMWWYLVDVGVEI